MTKITLKKFQLLDAYRTAPVKMGLPKLLARLAGTFLDSLYGKEAFDFVVVGDDPLVSLSIAVTQARLGCRVLLAPDSIGRNDWPTKDWGYAFANATNYFDDEVGAVLSSHIDNYSSDDGYMKALSALIAECAESGFVSILRHDYLQSSHGVIKGAEGLIFFPVASGYEHCPLTNPLWRMCRERIPTLEFQHMEIEYVIAETLLLTTPASRFIDPALGTRVGLAREEDANHNYHSRTENLVSAFTLTLRAK